MSSPSPSDLRVRWDAPLRATWLVVGVVVVVHVVSGLWWYAEGKGDLVRALVYDRTPGFRVAVGGQHAKLIEQGQYWRWFSSVWLHTGLAHLAVNASGLWALGRFLEPWIGAARWLAIFVAGGVAGSLASSFVGVTQSDGASGGGFALMGALWVLAWREWARLDDYDRRLLGPVWSAVLVGNLLLGLVLPFVDASAHAGGLVVGVVAGLLVPHPE
ncbi:MAG: rhomboid family intramembrane serine protease [Deltaproteobacteria bacterium]|nr:MAG: rhomboid family intramembrane serine protease [Deltaproteobacteria bacterium]